MELRAATAADADPLQRLLESDPGYTERVTGYPPGPADAQSLLLMTPEGVSAERKTVLLGRVEGEVVAVVDLIRGHPDPERAFIGLLLVDGALQGRGLGTAALAGAREWIASTWPEIATLRLAVVDSNAARAEPFWRARGFAPTGEERPYRYGRLVSTTRLWERPLRDDRGR